MSLFNAGWIGFDGEPITGRVPAQVRVMNNAIVTPVQYAQLAHAYKLFTDAKRVSVCDFFVQNRILEDGSRVRMESMLGQDIVMIWPAGAGGDVLPGGFYAVPTNASCRFGLPSWDPKFSGLWADYQRDEVPPKKLRRSRVLPTTGVGVQHPGNVTWSSPQVSKNGKPVVLSWVGSPTRYGRQAYYARTTQACNGVNISLYNSTSGDQGTLSSTVTIEAWKDAFTPWVWLDGEKFNVVQIVGESPVGVKVVSAGMKIISGVTHLFVVGVKDATPYSGFAVYSGPIETAGTITVAHRFDVNYFVNPTLVPTPIYKRFDYELAYGQQKTWECLLQPMYFNQSCTKASGIVSVCPHSTYSVNPHLLTPNPSGVGVLYQPVQIITLDIAAQTTSFSVEGANYQTQISASASFTSDGWGLPSGGTGSRSETKIVTTTSISAVDYKDDVLVVCLSSVWRKYVLAVGGYTNYGGIVEATQQEQSGYSVFIRGGATLASKESPLFQAYALSYRISDPGGSGIDYGTIAETISAEMYLEAEVCGGDLRHDCTVIAEYLENGTTNYSATYSPDSGYSGVSGSRGRAYGCRLRTMAGNVEKLVSTTSGENPALAYLTVANYSNFINVRINNQSSYPLVGTDSFSSSNTTNEPGKDSLRHYGQFGESPMDMFGIQYLNQTAFSPDGKYAYFGLGAPIALYGVPIASVAPATSQEFKIGNTYYPFTNELLSDAPDPSSLGAALSAAIFLGH